MLTVGQDPQLVNTDLFNGFLLSAQQETSCVKCQEVPLDVFLMNGYKISLSIMTTERSDQVLEVWSEVNSKSWIFMLYSLSVRWSRGSVLAFSTQVRGFKPGRSRRIFFKGEKILSMPSFGGEVKPSVPCRRFAACKRSLNVAWKSTFRQNYQTTFSPTVLTSPLRSLTSWRTWRHMVVKSGDV